MKHEDEVDKILTDWKAARPDLDLDPLAVFSRDALTVGHTFELFGQPVGLSASVRLSVEGGDVVVEPAGLTVAGLDLPADEVAKYAGPVLDPVLKPQTVCVRDSLPRGVTLTSIDLSRDGLARVEADLAPGILSDASQREHGSCASSGGE